MRFEHLIEINDPRLPLAATFPRDALWRGLLLRVHEPQRFPLGPERCEVRPGAAAGEWQRTLHFGALRLTDTVRSHEGESISFQPDAHGDSTPVNLTVRIEAPTPDALLLRFVYESVGPLSTEEAFYSDYRKSAWLANDRDMVRTLRQWLAEGSLSLS